MRFFTKDWYQTMQNTDLGMLLEIDSDADTFSESYYRSLYCQAKDKWLSLKAKVCELSKQHFEEQSEKRNFDRMCRMFAQEYTLNLPKNILDKVADIRVLALKRCSETVKEMIDVFVNDCQTKTKRAFEEYKEYENSQFSDNKPQFLAKFMFHDSIVLSMRKHKNDYCLTFDIDEDDDSNIKRIIFKNAEVVLMERMLAGAYWLYEEVHKKDDGYEICVLFYRNGIFEFTIKCDDILLE